MSIDELSSSDGPVETVIVPPTRDLGGFEVKRALPSRYRRMVGPFVFFDQMGPAILQPGKAMDVRPHPHIGLATVTYLFDGEVLHRDSLGNVQPIRPGEVNWMIAGSGIAHSERTPRELRNGTSRMFGIQVWVALPNEKEEMAPAFHHHEASELPVIEGEGKTVRLIAGTFGGARSPVKTLSEMLYADVKLEAGKSLAIPAEHEERGIFVVEGSVDVAGAGTFQPSDMLVLRPKMQAVVTASGNAKARVLLLGGTSLGPRHVWWNFVSSSRERIEQAKADWRAKRFGPVPGETEFIPLPDSEPEPVRYP